MLEIVLLIVACNYISKKAKEKGENARRWVLRTIGVWLLFEVAGLLLSLAITGGDLIMGALFGFVCGIGGFLLTKYQMDKLPPKKQDTDWHDRLNNE
jgi:membrane associated rhomboid family serine protease